MTNTKYKDGDIRWKWLEDRGFRVLADKHQFAYMQALFTDPGIVRGVFCDSPAGTGKTSLAVLAGAYGVLRGDYDRIIYIRNAVPVRDQGFLPGDTSEKDAPYMQPCADAMELVQPGAFEKWQRPGNDGSPPKLVCLTTGYTRGVTWDNAFVILDECQSFDLEELQTVYTRPTDTCKVVSIGSTRQVDNRKLKRIRGLTPFEVYMKHYEGQNVSYHKLVTNYRGEWSLHADKIQETVSRFMAEDFDKGYEGRSK